MTELSVGQNVNFRVILNRYIRDTHKLFSALLINRINYFLLLAVFTTLATIVPSSREKSSERWLKGTFCHFRLMSTCKAPFIPIEEKMII